MNKITNCLNSAASCVKSTLSFSAKAAGLIGAQGGLQYLIQKVGLSTPITAAARKIEFLTWPITHTCCFLTDTISKVLPSIKYRSPQGNSFLESYGLSCSMVHEGPRMYRVCKLSPAFLVAGVVEEVINRGVIQQKILPYIAAKLPISIGKVLNNKITRILLTSLIFASGHSNQIDVSSQFIGGIVYGAMAEATESLKLPILHHMFHNAIGIGLMALLHASGLI